jgi:DNA gyrase/topoisomerase IV subunit A
MTFSEILSAQGVAKEQCSVILKEMSRNRIFLTKEEKIEERYLKLKQKRDELKSKLDHAVCIIADLKNKLKENEKQLSLINAREKVIVNLKKECDFKIADMIITSAIHIELADAKYPELLIDKFDKTKLSINSDGIVEGIDEQLVTLKDTYTELFTTQEKCGGSSAKIKGAESEVVKGILLPDITSYPDVRNLENVVQIEPERREMHYDK